MMSWLPENVSTYGRRSIGSSTSSTTSPAATFFAVQVTLLVVPGHVPRPARAAGRPTRTATPRSRSSGRSSRRSSWSCSALMSRATWDEIKQNAAAERRAWSQVTAKQFNWEITYPGPDGKFGTADDVPAGQRPARAGEQGGARPAAVEGRHPQLLRPGVAPQAGRLPGPRDPACGSRRPRPGKYEIPCAELCGFGHSGMQGWL